MRFMPMPVRVPDLGNVKAIAAGAALAGAPRGRHGPRLGNNRAERWRRHHDEPGPPNGGAGCADAIAIAASPELSLALLANGTVMAWGGGNDNETRSHAEAGAGPEGREGGRGRLAHGVALTETGAVWTWGGCHSQLGRGRVPRAAGVVKELTGVQSIACRRETTVAVLATGRIMTWGEVRVFKRSDGRSNFSPAPIPLAVDGLESP